MANPPAAHRRQSQKQSPIPTLQLLMLSIIILAEQIAFNSVGPYLPQMILSFPSMGPDDVGLGVGVLATAFGAAQLLTNFFWGWSSDRIGRKPVLLLGTVLTAVGFVAFGFCRRLWQAVAVQAFMGAMNGNGAVVNTVMGEITDRTNQGDSFKWLPVVYGAGSLIGPLVGGSLANTRVSFKFFGEFDYLLPNLVVAGILLLDFAIISVFLQESREDIRPISSLWLPLRNLLRTRKHKLRPFSPQADPVTDETASLLSHSTPSPPRSRSTSTEDAHTPAGAGPSLSWRALLTGPLLALLVSYFIFNLSIVAHSTLYPTFAALPPPAGRGLTPREIGASLAAASLFSIAFQVGVFSPLQRRLGAPRGLRAALALFACAFALTPYIAYPARRALFWAELSLVLLLRTAATVLGLTLLMILITNSAPGAGTLGALNGVAQTLSAAGRALGPFAAGALYSLAARTSRRGEVAWLVFAAIAAVGFAVSWGVTGEKVRGLEQEEEPGSADEERGRLVSERP